MVRYKLASDTKYYYDQQTLKKFSLDHHRGKEYFVDILGNGSNKLLRMVRLICPDGKIVTCEVLSDFIVLDDPDGELFDGRFNQIR